jgi:hypothetical protein
MHKTQVQIRIRWHFDEYVIILIHICLNWVVHYFELVTCLIMTCN